MKRGGFLSDFVSSLVDDQYGGALRLVECKTALLQNCEVFLHWQEIYFFFPNQYLGHLWSEDRKKEGEQNVFDKKEIVIPKNDLLTICAAVGSAFQLMGWKCFSRSECYRDWFSCSQGQGGKPGKHLGATVGKMDWDSGWGNRKKKETDWRNISNDLLEKKIATPPIVSKRRNWGTENITPVWAFEYG